MNNFLIEAVNRVANIIKGTPGKDKLTGNVDDNHLIGLAGNDTLYGLDGNDTLEGGIDNDMLYGGKGDDTYVFSKGDGNDTISTGETTLYHVGDTIKFTDIEALDITNISRVGNNLVIKYGDSDSITVLNHFTTSPIGAIEFASDLNPSSFQHFLNHIHNNGEGLALTDKNDRFVFNDLNHKVNAGDGNDAITMGKGNDTLIGGTGNDTLYGLDGNDVLEGGKDNDMLYGGKGDDTYVFSKGDGNDTISTGETTISYALDTIKFTDIEASDITNITRVGNNLVIKYGDSDSITVLNHFTISPIGSIQFASDSYPSSFQDYLNHTYNNGNGLALTDKNDKFVSNDLDYKISAGDGNDVITTGKGYDTLIGGKGNDTLNGGLGADTYVFSKSDGNDVINTGDHARDTIKFTDIELSDITSINRVGNNLVIKYGDSDSITVLNHFTTSPIGYIQFASESYPNLFKNFLNNVYQSGTGIVLTDKNDNIVYNDVGYKISANAGNDAITSGAGNDTIYGGDGNDVIRAGAGHDSIIGGKGNDALYGGAGDDTYVFSKGDGKDIVHTGDTRFLFPEHTIDTIKFTDVSWTELTADNFSRVGNNLVINYGNGDSVTVANYFTTSPIGYIKFIDTPEIFLTDFLDSLGGLKLTDKSDSLVISNRLDNHINAGAGNDVVTGGTGNDTLNGELGNDRLTGGAGDDLLIGGKGNDALYGGIGEDTYQFSKGDGKDTITTGETELYKAVDIIKFTDITMQDITSITRIGNNLIINYGESDSITVLNHFTVSPIGHIQFGNNIIEFQHFLNEMFGGLVLTNKNDSFPVFNELDHKVNAGAGNDAITGGIGNDSLYGEAGNDRLIGGRGDDLLVGGIGNDTLNGGLGADTYEFSVGDGKDIINIDDGLEAVDTLKFTDIAPNQFIAEDFKRVGNNLVISYGNQGDTITIVNHFTTSPIGHIQFGDDPKLPIADFINHTLGGFILTDKNDSFVVSNGLHHKINAGAGNDVITGGRGNDSLYGEAGNDRLIGGEGFDLLVGGIGNDTLNGGLGADIYEFSVGDGKDIINTDDALEAVDTIRFTGITANQFIAEDFKRVGNNLVISYGNQGDTITIVNHFTTSPIGHIQFGDDPKLPIADFINHTLGGFILTDKNDSFVVSNGLHHKINAGAGNDVITGGRGNDSLYGEAGNDRLIGGEGSDLLVGGIGNDTLNGGLGADIYEFSVGDGKDIINTDDALEAVDTIRFTGITANQFIAEDFKRVGNNLVISYGGQGDTITIVNHFTTSPIGHIQFGEAPKLSIADFINHTLGGFILTDKNDSFVVSNGLAHKINAGAGNDVITGSTGNDSLYGEAGNDRLIGAEGDDLLVGGTGNDTLNGGLGADIYEFSVGDGKDIINIDDGLDAVDTLKFTDVMPDQFTIEDFKRVGNNLVISYGGQGDTITIVNHFTTSPIGHIQFGEAPKLSIADFINHTLGGFILTDKNDSFVLSNGLAHKINAGAGNDVITGSTGNDSLYGEAGNDRLIGAEGDDLLVGGTGNDTLNGGLGADIYEFSVGDGKDIINIDDGLDAVDTLKFTDVMPDQFTIEDFKRVGNNLVISYGGQGDTITIVNHFTTSPIGHIQFGEAPKLSIADFINHTLGGFILTDKNDSFVLSNGLAHKINAGAGNDVITGSTGNDSLYGEAGNDKLIGGMGDDLLVGGTGNDTLDGGWGADTYEFSVGDGKDIINTGDGLYAVDTLKFTDMMPNQFSAKDFKRVGNNLVISYGDQGDTITVVNHFNTLPSATVTPIGYIQFGDAPKLSIADFINELGGFILTDQNDKFLVFNGLDHKINAGAGNDVITTGAGNDTLIGGTGNDTLDGGLGDNTYEFSVGDGKDIIAIGNHLSDTIHFTDVDYGDLNLKRVGDNLVISYGTNDSVTIINHFTTSPIGLIQVGENEPLYFLEFLHMINGLQITGNVNLVFNDTSHLINMTDDGGTHTITMGAGDDIIYGGFGRDVLNGGAGDDYLFGGAGNDSLNGGTGDDTLNGGTGNNTLMGGEGDDVYIYYGSSKDVINNLSSTWDTDYDILDMGYYSFDDVSFGQEGNSLKIFVNGTTDSVTIFNWFAGGQYQLDEIIFNDTSVILTQVNSLINAMAAFNPPAMTETNLIDNKQQLLTDFIAVGS